MVEGDLNGDPSVDMVTKRFYGMQTADGSKTRCLTDTCPFRFVATRKTSEEWNIKAVTQTQCEGPQLSKRLGSTAYTALMLSSVLLPRLSEGLSLRMKEIRGLLRPLLRTEPSDSFLKRVRQAAIEQCVVRQV